MTKSESRNGCVFRKLYGASVLCAVCCLVVACGDSSSETTREKRRASRSASPSVEELLRQAEDLSRQGLNVDAAKLLEQGQEDYAEAERCRLYPLIAEYYHRGSVYGKALKNVELAAACGRPSEELLFIRGDSLRAERRLREARSHLEELLRSNPRHRRAKLALARILVRLGEARDALPLFEGYFSTQPGDTPGNRSASLEYGRALRAVKEHRAALDRFAALLIADPFDTVAYSELAQTFYRRKMRQEGRFIEQIYKAISQSAFEEFVEERLRASGMTAFALGQKAVNQVRQKRFLSAFRNYQAAMRIEATDPRLRIHYANLCQRFRRYSEGKRILKEVLDASVEPASGLWMARVMIEFEEGKIAAALHSARAGLAALRSESQRSGMNKGQGSAFTFALAVARGALETGEVAAAEETVKQAVAQWPAAWEPEYWLGRVEYARGRLAAASEAFARAREKGAEEFFDLRYWSAVLLKEQGDAETAAAILEEALKANPGDEKTYELFAEILARAPDLQRDPFEATYGHIPSVLRRIEELEKVVDRSPLDELGAVYLELGQLYRRLRNPLAFDFLFLTMDLLPKNATVLESLLSAMTRPQDIFLRLGCLNRLLKIEPGTPELMAEIAGIYVRLAILLDVARKLCEKLHRSAPSAISFRLLGELALREGNKEEGLRWLNEGRKNYPHDLRLQQSLKAK